MEPGTRLARYEIVSAIGKGGLGELWRARQQARPRRRHQSLWRTNSCPVLPDAWENSMCSRCATWEMGPVAGKTGQRSHRRPGRGEVR